MKALIIGKLYIFIIKLEMAKLNMIMVYMKGISINIKEKEME